MKLRSSVIAVVILLFCSTSSMALFTNGGFEAGDLSGWDLDFGTVSSGTDYQDIVWGASDHGLYGIWDSSSTMYGQTLDVDPYGGTYMARLNDIYGGYHATQISQSDTITQQDIDDGATLYVNWGAMLIEPSNVHPTGDQPNFGVNVTIGGDTTFYTANALAHLTDPDWTLAGSDGYSDLWYNTQTWSFDLLGLNAVVGSVVDIALWVTDCGWSGHGGYAFLDGIGTIDPRTDPVPEPATWILMGTGLAGLAFYRRRKSA